jgi:sulfur carrier protein
MTATSLEVTVNGELVAVASGTTIATVVERFSGSTSGMAVALNDAVLPRSRWSTTTLSAHDRVEILTPAQGG